MAIASILALHTPQDQGKLREILGSMPPIIALNCVNHEKMAVTLEIAAPELTGFLKKLSALPEILNLELIFVNYEDDLDEAGFMQVPPESKKFD